MPSHVLVASTAGARGRWWAKLSCALWGHHVDNHAFARQLTAERRCRCGITYLDEDGGVTRVRHTLSCFLGHHTYERLTDRHGCHEYVCVQCGHPLVFGADRDPYASRTEFDKKVRYRCGLFGHRVSFVAERDGMHEYACFCGHTFLKPAGGARKVHHPLRCVFLGHWIRFVTHRARFAEYVCRTCGHPFCFADPIA